MNRKKRLVFSAVVAIIVVAASCVILYSLSGRRLIPPAGDGCWYALEGTYWEQIPHPREKIAGKVILSFQDSVASRTLYAPKSGLSTVMASSPYVASADGVRIDSLAVSFIGQDTLFYFGANGEQTRFARISSDSVARISSETEDLSTLIFNNELAYVHYARDTRFFPIEEPGMLLPLVQSTPEHVLKSVETLCICGPMNGIDISTLHVLLANDNALPNIRRLDLSRAWIVSDSIPYSSYSLDMCRSDFESCPGIRRRVVKSEDEFVSMFELQSSLDTIDVARAVDGYVYELERDSFYLFFYTTIQDKLSPFFLDNMPYIEELVLPYSLQSVEPCAFHNCPKLRRVSYPSTAIGRHIFELNSDRLAKNAGPESDALFFNCDPNIRFEPYAERITWPKVKFSYCYKPEEYVGQGEFEKFEKTVHVPQNMLIRVTEDIEVIVEANAHIQVDFKGKKAWGAPLTEAYSSYCAKIRPLAKNLEQLNLAIQCEWRGDSIIAMERRIAQAQSEILSHLVHACIENKSNPVPAYLVGKYQNCLSASAMQYLLMIMDDENAFSASTKSVLDWLKMKSLKDNFDWDLLADTTFMHLVRVPQPGMLRDMLLQENVPVRRLRVEGTLNADDLDCLKSESKHLDVLDLGKAEIGIYLPDGLFCNSNLRYVRLPETLQTIGQEAFRVCQKLQQVVFPPNLVSIRSEAFCGCLLLRHLDFPERLQFIESKAFMYCLNLREVCLPDSLYAIDYLAFSRCPYLMSVYIPAGTVSIGMNLTLDSPLANVMVHPDNKFFASYAGHLVGLTEASRKILHQYEPFGTLVDKKKKQ